MQRTDTDRPHAVAETLLVAAHATTTTTTDNTHTHNKQPDHLREELMNTFVSLRGCRIHFQSYRGDHGVWPILLPSAPRAPLSSSVCGKQVEHRAQDDDEIRDIHNRFGPCVLLLLLLPNRMPSQASEGSAASQPAQLSCSAPLGGRGGSDPPPPPPLPADRQAQIQQLQSSNTCLNHHCYSLMLH